MLRILIAISLFFLLGSLVGQNVTISGQAKEYAGRELVFYYYPEPVAHLQHRLAETKVAPDGSFTVSLKTDKTIEVYVNLEKYFGTLVTEPAKQYQIVLPPFSPRTATETASPFFTPELFWLGIKRVKTTDLNFLVRSFLTDYNKELASHTEDLYRKRSADTVRAIIARLERDHPETGNEYFKILKTYSLGELEFTIVRPDREPIIRKYFSSEEVYWSHPAFQQLFRLVFSDYLADKYMDIKQRKSISPALGGEYSTWVKFLVNSGFKQEIAELVAVKSFYDGYHSNKLDKQVMLKGLKEAMSAPVSNSLKEHLPEILGQISSLQEGNTAPVLLLTNQNNIQKVLRPNGKFLYIAFFRSDSKDCRAELDSMMVMDKKLNAILTFVPVSLDKYEADAQKLWKEKKYPWELSRAADAEKAISDYHIRNVPEFYLVSPDNKLSLSPALAPSRNFEPLFLKVYRDSRYKK